MIPHDAFPLWLVRRGLVWLLLLLLVTMLVTGCTLWPDLALDPPANSTSVPNNNTAVDTLPNQNPNEPDENTAVIPAPSPNTQTPQGQTQLVIWTIPALSTASTSSGNELLEEQIRAFEATYPNLDIHLELKEASGPGSINSYLSTARPVAPSILPDIILLPIEQMREAANSGLIYPLNEFVSSELQADFYPAAQTLVTTNDNIWGVPYALRGLTHTAYNSDIFTPTVPLELAELINTPAIMVMPVAGDEGSKLLLQYYLEAGGRLVNENGQPQLEVEPLTAALTALKEARDLGVIHPQSYTLQSMDEAWQIYRTGSGNLTLTQPTVFINNREAEGVTQFTAVPGARGPLRPLLTGWAWSISTPDPAKQEIAAEFLTWITSSENMGAWSQESNRLPARQSAFETWPATPYVTFLQAQLNRAQAYPFAAQGAINTQLSQNLVILLSPTGGDPAQLAEQAANAIQP